MAEYRIDDLARLAGATVRNVRVYQDRGLLPPPRRQGRVGWYSDAHLARLRLISRLLERGYTFAHIGELVTAWEQGRNLGEVLGLEEALTRPWSDEEPAVFTLADLRRMFGTALTPGAVRRAVALGVLHPDGSRLRAPSPRLLAAGADLVAAGVPLPAVLDLAAALAGDLDVVAHRFVALVRDQLLGPAGPDGLPAGGAAQVAGLVSRLRPLAARAVDAMLAAAMERQVTAVLGEAASRLAEQRRSAAQPDPTG